MSAVLTIIHIFACIFLILVVLLQTGKGADMGAVFGGSSSTVFGSTGAGNFLTRLTTATAIIFMLTSMSLTYLSASQITATVFDAAPVAESPAGAPPLAGDAPVPEVAPVPLPQAVPQAETSDPAAAALPEQAPPDAAEPAP